MVEYSDNMLEFNALPPKERADTLAASALMAAAQIANTDKRLELITATLDFYRTEMAFDLLRRITVNFTLIRHPRTIAQQVARAVKNCEGARGEVEARLGALVGELLKPEEKP